MIAVADLVKAELATINDSALVTAIHALMVEPYAVDRDWDYGLPGQTYVCWTVAEHPLSNTAIVYCESGFGPAHPWGLVSLSGPNTSMGMDSSWYARLEDAVRESAACNLPLPPNGQVD